ncbi:S41 family peptidase [Sphingomonas sp.]|uniref:S41 family peptidase n=1 Tax=Sphingomonas sp. TaxID=28214 RepID=UPI002E37A14D|nr:S41 family peptidase [Sphingomonas sp.]HEX4695562.1 S41 family peptidase [Sphingomonas sp.]
MERRVFLGLSAAAIAALGSGAALAQGAGDDTAATVNTLATLLENGYVIPEIGKRYAAMLRTNLAAGAYAGLGDPIALASRLTTDLAAVSADRHLRVIPQAALPPGEPVGGQPAPQPGARPSPAPQPGGPRPIRRASIEDAGWLAKDVAYIRYTGFTGDPAAVAATAEFMKTHAAAKAVVIDCRYNNGGGISEMNAMLPYLYGKPTTLVRMEMVDAVVKSRGGSPFDGDGFVRPAAGAAAGISATEHYVVPKTDETRLFGAKVFYLTSTRTASAAEHLALAFKRTKRATLIGEATAGANHFGGFESIGMGLAVFLPVGRTVDPDTGKDWEGTGIAPDVAVAPTLALEEALRRAGALSAV